MDFLFELIFVIFSFALSKLLDFIVSQDGIVELDHLLINMKFSEIGTRLCTNLKVNANGGFIANVLRKSSIFIYQIAYVHSKS